MSDIGYDQIAWLKDILKRYEETLALASKYPRVSRLRDMAKLAAIIEISEITCNAFENKEVLLSIIDGICEVDI